MFKASYQKHTLTFKRPGGTSRGVLTEKTSWFLFIHKSGVTGIGECSIIEGLSPDNMENYEATIASVCDRISRTNNESDIEQLSDEMVAYPSIRFGIEMALKDLQAGGKRLLFESTFSQSNNTIPINGLVWMGDYDFMEKQVKEKIAAGFNCIKLKIGAINFEEEMNIIENIRSNYTSDQLMIRVDANGAFSMRDCLEKLNRLAQLKVHSIEQPIAKGNVADMAALCLNTPIPIALDEELIGVFEFSAKKKLLEAIKPQYIILKPSLLGGFKQSEEWIHLARLNQTGWWITSALESNIGLNAIAQWTSTLNSSLHQGLGTGQLYTNNFPSPLRIENGFLLHRSSADWDLKQFINKP